MSKYQKRKSNLYQAGSPDTFRISRSKIDMFIQCPRCFYIDRRLGLGKPSMPGWSLNVAVDQLLKKEFDLLRKKGEAHELMKQYNIDAIPFDHPNLADWRDDYHRYVGACVLHKPTNLEVCGIVDDIWINKAGELLIVDYKATSTQKEISLEDEYKQGYKRQMEIYQWIYEQMGFKVSPTGYFVFANASKNRPNFDGRLEFAVTWVEKAIFDIKQCLESNEIPAANPDCEHCTYRYLIGQEENK